MTLLWTEGFEGFGTTGPPTPDIDRKYSLVNRTANMVGIITGRMGRALNTATTSNPYFQTPNLGTISEIVIGFAFKFSAFAHGALVMYIIEGNAALGCNLTMFASNKLIFRRGSTILAASNVSLRPGAYHYVELKMTVHDTTGSATLKINGVEQFALTNIDTKVSSTTTSQGARFYGNSTGQAYTYDDIYICDTTGSANNDFIGSIRIDGILPDSAGDDTDWTPSAGNNHDAVDENPQDDDTTYVEDSTSTNRDLYNYAAMANVGVIKGLQMNSTGRETDVTTYTLKQSCKSGSTLDTDAGVALNTQSYITKIRILEEDPDTSTAWIEAGVNAAQFGVEVG